MVSNEISSKLANDTCSTQWFLVRRGITLPWEGASLVGPGEHIGEWVVEESLDGHGRFRCHRHDSPFRKAVLTAFRGPDRAGAEALAAHLARLHHPNIGGVLGAAVSGDELYVVAELVQGASLRTFLHEGGGGPIPSRTALTVGYEVADALATAHERGVIHGDVRPESIVLGLDGKARLVGFERMGTSDDLSVAARYSAPELADHAVRPTPSSDAYAFGVVLFELFSAPGAPVPLLRDRSRSLDERLPRAIRELVSSLTHPDPVVRPGLSKARQVLQQQLLDLSQSQSSGDGLHRLVPDLAEDAPPPLPTRIGRYDVVRELGRGGVGVVYEGVDPVLNRRVALKLLIAGSWARPREVQRFKLEAQAVARLDHPSIVKILDIGGDLEGAWFAMEFVDGPSLADRMVQHGGRLPWAEAVSIASQIARALQHAHESGLLHRDVKPNNVLLEGPRAKLADFGLAFDAASDATRLTGTGQVLGTPTYMAPEQAAGELTRLGPATDVYGLGVLLYEALTAKVPFEGATPLQVIGNILTGNAAPPRRHVPDLPRQLDTIVAKALRLDPKDRYPSASAFAEDLDRLLAGESILAADPTPYERLRHFVGHHRRTLASGAVVALVVLGLVAGGSWVFAALDQRGREHGAADALEGTRRRIAAALEAGRPDEAESAFRNFVDRPEHLGTRALVAAWIERSQVLDAAGDGEGRLSALSSAYLAARAPEDVDRTLVQLAQAAHEERAFELVVRLGDLLSQQHPHLSAQVRPAVRDALAAQRHLAAASALVTGDAASRALEVLSEAVRTDWHNAWVLSDPNAPGRHFVASDSVIHATGPSLVTLPGTTPLPLSGRIVSLDAGATTQFFRWREAGDHSPTWAFDGERFVDTGVSLPTGEVSAVAIADLDSDGVEEAWAGAWRFLQRLDAEPGGWRMRSAHEETNASNSQIGDLVAGDVDGDARPDLVVAAGEWGAYDVRRFSWDAGSRSLALVDRARLGVVVDLATTRSAGGQPRIAACKVREYPNLRVFPESAPFGDAEGVWELAFTPGRPVERRLVFPVDCRMLAAGDVDGDGLEDLIVSNDERILLALRRPDDGFDEVWLEEVSLAAVIQADADAAVELVVNDHADADRDWVLGVSGAPEVLPPLAPRTVTRQAAPQAPAAFQESWRRADDLAAIGQLADAQRAFRDLSSLRWGADEGRDALLRAADLAFARGAYTDASALYLEADAAGTEGALLAAVRSRRAGRDEPGELALLERAQEEGLLDDELAARRALLRPSAVPPVEFAFAEALDPQWSVGESLWVSHDAGPGELVLEPTGPGELLRLPVVVEGRWLGVELVGQVDRTEWGAGVTFAFVRRGTDDAVLRLELAGRGGGEIVDRRVMCTGPDSLLAGGVLPGGPGVALHASAWLQRDGSLRCAGEGHLADWSPGEHDQTPAEWPSGDWDFVVASTSAPTAAASLRLTTLRLSGVRVDEVASVAPAPPATPWSAFVAAVHRQDVLTAISLVATLPPDEAVRARRWLLHARLDSWGASLRSGYGADWYTVLADAWQSPLLSEGRRDPGLRDTLLRWTDGAEASTPASEAAAAQLQLLLLAKGGAALHANQLRVARASLERAIALGLPRDAAEHEVQWTRSLVAVGFVDLAEIAVREGRVDEVFGLLDRAFATTPVPLILGDVADARAAFAPLRSDPRWNLRVTAK
jgi:serine/threonine protein kinase